jgi:hypothetical protein
MNLKSLWDNYWKFCDYIWGWEEEMETTEQESNNNVEHPSHYNQGDIECIDAIKAALTPEEFEGFIKGTVIKYMWRAKHKGQMEDMKKGWFYLNWMLSFSEKK